MLRVGWLGTYIWTGAVSRTSSQFVVSTQDMVWSSEQYSFMTRPVAVKQPKFPLDPNTELDLGEQVLGSTYMQSISKLLP
jgi:hypothetical protein